MYPKSVTFKKVLYKTPYNKAKHSNITTLPFDLKNQIKSLVISTSMNKEKFQNN